MLVYTIFWALCLFLCLVESSEEDLFGPFSKETLDFMKKMDNFEEVHSANIELVVGAPQANTKDRPPGFGKYMCQDPDLGFLKWACPIPYEISENVEEPSRVTKAIEYLQTVTKWSFVKRSDQRDYLNFVHVDDGCFALICSVFFSLSLFRK